MNLREFLRKIRFWWYRNRPYITTRNAIDDECIKNMIVLERVIARNRFSVLNPVIYDLEKLRTDTWNQDKITHIQEWLRQYIGDEEKIFKTVK